MTITVAQAGVGGFTDNNLIAPRALGSNVAVGDLIVVSGVRWIPTGTNPFTAGFCTQTAGTATVGTVTLDRGSGENAFDAGAPTLQAGVWSCLVTGAGSLTMSLTGTINGYWHSVISAFAASTGWGNAAARVEAVNSVNQATNSTTSVNTGGVSSAAGALFYAHAGFDAGANPYTMTPEGTYTLINASTDGSTHQTGSAIRKIVTTGSSSNAPEWPTIGSGNNGFSAAIVVYKETTPDGGGAGTTRGKPFDSRGNAFNGGRTFIGPMARLASGVLVPSYLRKAA